MPIPVEQVVESQFVEYLLAGIALLGAGVLYYFRREQNRLEAELEKTAAELATRAKLEDIRDMRSDFNRAVQNRDEELRQLRDEFNRDMAALDHDVKNLGERLVDMIRAELTTMRSEHQRERVELNSRFDQMILALRMRERE